MQFHRLILNQHRLRRLALWTLAVLSWIAAMLFSDRPVTFRHVQQRFDLISLPWLTSLVGKLIIVRAGELARLRCAKHIYWRRGRDIRPPHLFRSVLGARLRRALTHKDARVWIANLIAALHNIDVHAARLAKRLRRGLTRLWPTRSAIALAVPSLGPPAPPPAFSDSS
jgi:hypothetical protein